MTKKSIIAAILTGALLLTSCGDTAGTVTGPEQDKGAAEASTESISSEDPAGTAGSTAFEITPDGPTEEPAAPAAEGTGDEKDLQPDNDASDSSAGDPDGSADLSERIMNDMSTKEKVEQMLMPDIRDWTAGGKKEGVKVLNDELAGAIKDHNFGGIILFADNISDAEQTVRLVDQINAANLEGGHESRLFIAIDQEGGRVTRLATGTQMPGNMAIGATGDPGCARRSAAVIGSELNSLGINVDFSPVMDVNNNPSNPIIGIRSFSDDPETAGVFGKAAVEGFHETGTIVSLKHFPGHGDTQTDSHTGLPLIDKSYAEIQANELISFESCINTADPDLIDGADMIMTAHIQYPKIETETYTSIKDGKSIYLPATLSKKILTGILREDLGFDGVIVTDALDMAAISENFDPMDSARLAINAGADIMLMPVKMNSGEGIAAMDEFVSGIVRMVENGEIPETRINESVFRILKLKEKYGLLGSRDDPAPDSRIQAAVETVGSKANHDAEWEIACRAVTLVKNEGEVLPLKAGEKTTIVCGDASQELAVRYALERLQEDGITGGSADVRTVCLDGVKDAERDGMIDSIVSGSDTVVVISVLSSALQLDPAAEDGKLSAWTDRLIDAIHGAGGRAVIISSQLPYDLARYGEADGLFACYNAKGMTELPGDFSGNTPQYGPNIPACIYTAFGGNAPAGVLPVNIPALDNNFAYSGEILYNRGWGLGYSEY